MNAPRVEMICLGSELLSGKINTHATYLGQRLATVGLEIAREHTVGDDPALMREAFREVWRRSDIVISAGGLGPTFDDLTRDIWSEVLRRPLRVDSDLARDIAEKFRSRGVRMPSANRRQAQVLAGAEVVDNRNGTAPGQLLVAGKKVLVLLPGPTRELRPMVEEAVLPRLRQIFPDHHARQKAFLLTGVPESHVDEVVRPLVKRLTSMDGCRIVHGILASQSVISVKFTVQGPSADKVDAVTDRLTAQFRKKLGSGVFGEDEDTLESAVARLLVSRKKTLAVAESCTGGLIAKMLTDMAGASDYFHEGVVTYSNASKTRRLGVPAALIKRRGAVSREVARAMALGLRRRAATDYALSVTGIAGPAGGSPQKPVGLVYIGVAGPGKATVKEFRFNGDRDWIRYRSAVMAIDLLRRALLR